MNMKTTWASISCAALVAAALPVHDAIADLTPAERAAGWTVLFDGASTEAWRGYRRDDVPAGWQVVDGALTRTDAGGDIVTVEQFADFVLEPFDEREREDAEISVIEAADATLEWLRSGDLEACMTRFHTRWNQGP